MKNHQLNWIVLALLISCSSFSAAQQLPQLYISSEGQSSLQLLDLNTSKLTTLYQIGAKPDDLTLNAAGQLIYSVPNSGTVNLYDSSTGTNTTLVSGISGVRDLEIEAGGQSMLIAKYAAPAEIIRYNFSTGTTSVLVGKAAKVKTFDGLAYDVYGNLYAVANHNTIIQVDPVQGTILATLTLEPHVGVNGGDGLTYDSYTNSLWATHDGKTGKGLLQISISPTGFTSTTSSDFTFFPFTGIASVDGIKSDGKGNLYIGALWSALMYNIPTNTIVKNVVVKGADGVSLVPGTY
jgi:hypothetical protein